MSASLCRRCRRGSHTAERCYAATRADGSRISDGAALIERGAARSHIARPVIFAASPTTRCSRCWRDSHAANQCYASTRVDGLRIPDGAAHTDVVYSPAARASGGVNSGCFRCGRNSHEAGDCYASTRADGSRIPDGSSDGSVRPERGAGRSQLARARGGADASAVRCFFCDREGHSVRDCPRMLTYDARDPSLRELPPKNRRVVNIKGSSLDLPSARSWQAEAESILGPSPLCAVLGCVRQAEEGAHVFVEGERDAYFIAPMCKPCNHRHGHSEMCFCRFVTRREEPQAWISIRDMWLMKIKFRGATDVFWRPFSDFCAEKSGAHGYRDRCSVYCVGGRNEPSRQ